MVEVDVDNLDGTLLPGAYVQVHLKLRAADRTLTVPVNVLLFRSEGIGVAAVRDGRIVLLPITIGHDYGDRCGNHLRRERRGSIDRQPAGLDRRWPSRANRRPHPLTAIPTTLCRSTIPR